MTYSFESGIDGVAEPGAVPDHPAVQEDGHVLAQFALLVEDVAAGPRVSGEHGVEHLAHRGARDLRRRTGHVALDGLGERDRRHAGHPP